MADEDCLDNQNDWPPHVVRAGPHFRPLCEQPSADKHRESIEPWLSALLQAEHLNLLIGSGLTTAIAHSAKAPKIDMKPVGFPCDYADAIVRASKDSAKSVGRCHENFEDQIRAVSELIAGLRILADAPKTGIDSNDLPSLAGSLLASWEFALNDALESFVDRILDTERGIKKVFAGECGLNRANSVRRLLGGFLLPFASRAATRDRLHIFTTNYDRLIEYGCDLLGLRTIDRFVGNLTPVFHSSRLGIDYHYNPPGMRGEPRYLEGVVRLTKLHGSIDWESSDGASGLREVQRLPLRFGAGKQDQFASSFSQATSDNVLIYPNPSKDSETLEFPYAEMFRDFAAAVCQPNGVVVTYGYGFGDDHVNRVLLDMLSIPSTHLVIISYDHADGRVPTFCRNTGRDAQITLLVGSHFGDLTTLVEQYLPKPAIDRTTLRMMDLLRRRAKPQVADPSPNVVGASDEEVVN